MSALMYKGCRKVFFNNFACLHDVRMQCKPLVECFCCKCSKSTYTVSVIKKVKVPYRTRTVLLANLERTSSIPLIAQRTHSSVRFGTLRFSAVRGAVWCGTAAVIRAFQHGIDPEPDRGPPNSTWHPFLSRCHNNFVDRVKACLH